MKYFIILYISLFFHQIDWGQGSSNDSIPKKKRVIISSSIMGVAYASSLVALNGVWYKEFPKSKFHFFNDGLNWLQMDKFGHVFSGYMLSQKNAVNIQDLKERIDNISNINNDESIDKDQLIMLIIKQNADLIKETTEIKNIMKYIVKLQKIL